MHGCSRCIVRGRVQGVAFRAAARRMADSLALTGWVRNLADGSVETVACGEEQALAAFRRWLHRGPPYAIVREVECEPHPDEAHAGFVIRR